MVTFIKKLVVLIQILSLTFTPVILAQSWSFVDFLYENIRSIDIPANNDSIIYIGTTRGPSSGNIYKSSDNGDSFILLRNSVQAYRIFTNPQNSRTVFAAIEEYSDPRGGIIKSYDSGNNWIYADSGINYIEEPPGMSIVCISSTDSNLVFAEYHETWISFNKLYKSTDSGINYSKVNFPFYKRINSIEFEPVKRYERRVYFGADQLYYSDDNAENIEASLDSGHVARIAFSPFDNNTIYISIIDKGMFVSIDRGETWERENDGLPTTDIRAILVNPTDSREIFIGTDMGVYRSYGSEIYWEPMNDGLNNRQINCLSTDKLAKTLWAGTDMGLYKTDLLTSVDEYKNNALSNFELKPNYPNPFNPTTTITYSIPKQNFVTLKVYNTLGKEVALLVNGYKVVGDYSVVFDGGDLPSGVYFYSITAGRFSEVRKMTLIK